MNNMNTISNTDDEDRRGCHNLMENRMFAFKDDAVDVASKSYHKYHKHGALLVRNGQIISSGFNDENRHAEHNAILAGYRLLCGSRQRKVI